MSPYSLWIFFVEKSFSTASGMSSRAGGTRVEITEIVWTYTLYTRSELSERSLTKISEYHLYHISFMYVTNSVWNVFFSEKSFSTARGVSSREALAWKSQRLYRCIPDQNRLSAVSLIFPNFLYVQKEGKNIKQARCFRDQKINHDLPYRAPSFFFTIWSQYSKTCQSKERPFWLK